MAHFLGSLEHLNGAACVTRSAHKTSGLDTVLRANGGSVRMAVWHDPVTGHDLFEMWMLETPGGKGFSKKIAWGVIGKYVEYPHTPEFEVKV